MANEPYRQGDIFLLPVAEIPAKAKKMTNDRLILAEGESTGHMHEIMSKSTTLYELSGVDTEDLPEIFAEVEKQARLVHPEHDTISIDPGIYKVIRQREDTGNFERTRYVSD